MANLTVMLNRAVAAYNKGQLNEAEQLCQRIIAIKRNFFDALHLVAVVQSRLGKKDEALASYDRALKVRPDYAEALSNRGLTLQELKRFEEALASYERALKVRPDYAEALSNRGNTLNELNRFEEALASYDGALKVRPDLAEALFNRGVTLGELKRFEEALASYDRALKVRPDYAEALSNRGVTLQELKRFEEALASYDRALKVRPDFADALSNRGVTLQDLKRFEEALASYDRALKVRPDYAEALSSRGVTLRELNRFEEALTSYDSALKVRPDFADALYNRGLIRLLVGQYKDGWADHEWRWETTFFPSKRPKINVPIWQGEDLSGRHLLVFSEQGLGDVIQFTRYLPLLVERKCKVTFFAPVQLKRLLKLSFQSIEIVSELEGIHGIDFQVALMSLPHRFNTEPLSIPNKVPYLKIEPHLETRWKDRIGTQSFKIGIAWSGRPTHKNDHNRSINLSLFLPLLDAQATFVSLQTDIRPNDAALLKEQKNILNFGEELKDFSDTAAIISNLDLVISIDTSVAHLAGALGKPIWVLLPFIPDWRWLLDREDSPWYPTARLFRQNGTRVWDTVIARVSTALHDFVQTRPAL